MTGRLHASPSFEVMMSARRSARWWADLRKGWARMTRVRDLLTTLMLAQFAWGGSALAQTVPDEATSDGLAKNECLSSAAAPDAAASDAGVSWCYTKGAYISLSATATPAPYIGARSDPGSVEHPIDVWEICRYVDNFSTNSYFVPFNSESEWKAFIDNAPVSHSADTYCSRATQISVEPEAVCTQYTPVSPPPAFALPYARNGNGDPTADQILTTSYTCHSNPAGCVGGVGNPWTETATQTFAPGKSPDDQLEDSGWSVVPDTLSYDGTPAPVCTPGQCGPANGVAATSAPTSGLCSAGTATAVSGSGPWTWSCDGINNGTTASCSDSDILSLPTALASTLPPPPAQCTITSAYYVNCALGGGGSGTAASPFGSLAQAQSAMENSGIKTAIVSGTCTLGGTWNFSPADAGETWEADCGQSATINGNNAYAISATNATGLTFYGFTFDNLISADWGDDAELTGSNYTFRWNTFNNCVQGCINGPGIESSIFDSNTFNGGLDNSTGTHFYAAMGGWYGSFGQSLQSQSV